MVLMSLRINHISIGKTHLRIFGQDYITRYGSWNKFETDILRDALVCLWVLFLLAFCVVALQATCRCSVQRDELHYAVAHH